MRRSHPPCWPRSRHGRTRSSARASSASTPPWARSTARSSTSTGRRWPPGTRSPRPAAGSSPRWRRCCTRRARASAASSPSSRPAARASSPSSSPDPSFLYRRPPFEGGPSVGDWSRDFANSGIGTPVIKQLGLPRPAVLRRYEPGEPLLPGPAVVGSAGEGRLRDTVTAVLKDGGVSVVSPGTADGSTDGEMPAAVILDATGLTTPADLAAAHDFLAPAIKGLRPSGRVVILGEPASDADSPAQAAARQALDGLVRSIGKELRDGSTANLLYVPAGAEASVASPLTFFLSGRSAYVDGQPVTLAAADIPDQDDVRPLAGKVAVVTGAARGIGASIAAGMGPRPPPPGAARPPPP